MGCLQLTYKPKFKIVHRTGEPMRSHEAKSVQLWLSVDPLAVYNPVIEDEFYGDGQHNGGVYNSGNLNSYGYCYQNPILYVDPNGKQSKAQVLNVLNSIENVENVLSGKKWINIQYNDNCFKSAKKQNNEIKNSNPTGGGFQINMYIDSKRQKSSNKNTPEKSFLKGLNTIISNLKRGNPVVVGVMYERTHGADSDENSYVGDNNNVATNHFINIVGMGIDQNGRYYFSYYDNYADYQDYTNDGSKEKVGTNLILNRFYLNNNKDNNQYLFDSEGCINGTVHEAYYGKHLDYIITEVRENN